MEVCIMFQKEEWKICVGQAKRRSPSRIEGLGSLIDGVWGRVPLEGSDKVRSFCHAKHSEA